MRVRASGLSTRQLWALLIGIALGSGTWSYSDALIAEPLGHYLSGPTARALSAGLWVGAFVAVAFWIEQKVRRE